MKQHSLVVDASLTMSWLFDDEATPLGERLLDQLDTLKLFVPSIWTYEVCNCLLVAEKKKRLIPARSIQLLNTLAQFPIEVIHFFDDHSTRDILTIGREFNLSSYDAAYLSLAVRDNLPLLTLDKALAKAAKKCNLPEFS